MQTSIYRVAGVPLYDTAPILYLDDPKKLGRFIDKFKPAMTFDELKKTETHMLHDTVSCACDKAPFLALTTKFMMHIHRVINSNQLSNVDVEPIAFDFFANMNHLQQRLMLDNKTQHGFIRWYRTSDTAILVIVRKNRAAKITMFVGMVSSFVAPDKLWDHFFAAMQSAGA